MKKYYAFLLLLTMVLFTGNLASAYTFKLQWETPGSVEISAGNIEYFAKPQDVSDKTEYEYSFGTYDNIWVGVSPGAGYKLVKAVQNVDNSVVVEPNAAGKIIFNGNGWSTNLTDKTYTIYCEKVALNDEFNVNVINGSDYFSAAFANGATLNLEKGNHSYSFNSATDGALTITPQGIPTLYSVTLDGAKVYQQTNKTYNVPVQNGSNLVIQAFENPAADAPETCKLTFEYGPNMEGCLYSIHDWTTSSFVEGNIVNNTLDLQGYTDLQLNFVPNDYTITKVYLDGEDITSLLITSAFDKSQKLRFTVPNQTAATIRIEGNAKVWGTVNFTGYISGVEGVEFSETYGGSAFTLPEGEALTSSFSVGGYQLNASNAQKFVIPISEKTAKMFFRPKAGYYIAEFYVSTNNSPNEQNSGAASIIKDQDGTYFWMVVKELGDTYTFDITTTGTAYYGKLSSADQSIISNWDNPEGLKLTLSEGTQTVTFYPGYSLPALISVSGDDSKNPAAYLDGAPLAGTINSDSNATEFTFTPYCPTEGDGIPEGTKSDVQVYLTTARPTMSGASLECENGATAQFFYSPIRREADPAGQAVISGTQMIVKPASPDCIIKYRDQEVTLDENGEFVFTATGNARNNIVTVSLPKKYADMLVQPAPGSTVKSLSVIRITLPPVDPNFESMLDFNEDVLPQLCVKKGDEVVATFGELGETTADDEGNTIVQIILSEPIEAAGEYTLVIPEGAFIEKQLSDADEAMIPVVGGFITPAYNGNVTVDPNAKSILEYYTLDPASGTEVSELSAVKITFDQLSAEEYFSGCEFPNATFTNGTETIEAIVNYDWNSESEYRVMTVTPIDAGEEPVAISAPGKWTLTVAPGTFTYNGDANTAITAEYTINQPWELNPAPGSTLEAFENVKLSFPKATSAEFVGGRYSMFLTNGNSYASPGLSCVKDETASVPTFILSLPEGAQKPSTGEYKLLIDEGAFTVDGMQSVEISAAYTMNPVVSTEYMKEPSDKVVCSEYGIMFALIYDETVSLTTPDISKVTISFDGKPIAATSFELMTEGNMLMFAINDQQYFKAGVIGLNIKAGAFNISGTPNPEITDTWEVIVPKTYEAVVTVGDGNGVYLSNLSTIYINFPEATTGEIYIPNGACLRSKDYSYYQRGTIRLADNSATTEATGEANKGVTFVVTFDEAPTVVGDYELSVMAGTFILDGTFESSAIEEKYMQVSGISEIFSDENGNVTVYTIDGRAVLTNEAADKLNTLDKGLYIVNGHKVLLK